MLNKTHSKLTGSKSICLVITLSVPFINHINKYFYVISTLPTAKHWPVKFVYNKNCSKCFTVFITVLYDKVVTTSTSTGTGLAKVSSNCILYRYYSHLFVFPELIQVNPGSPRKTFVNDATGFVQDWCPSNCPTNSIKALKDYIRQFTNSIITIS